MKKNRVPLCCEEEVDESIIFGVAILAIVILVILAFCVV